MSVYMEISTNLGRVPVIQTEDHLGFVLFEIPSSAMDFLPYDLRDVCEFFGGHGFSNVELVDTAGNLHTVFMMKGRDHFKYTWKDLFSYEWFTGSDVYADFI